MSKFPGPYVNDCKADDPMMIRVDLDKTEIGSRSSGMPNSAKSESMGIRHVGMGTNGKGD